jgi:hypothetical protein
MYFLLRGLFLVFLYGLACGVSLLIMALGDFLCGEFLSGGVMVREEGGFAAVELRRYFGRFTW